MNMRAIQPLDRLRQAIIGALLTFSVFGIALIYQSNANAKDLNLDLAHSTQTLSSNVESSVSHTEQQSLANECVILLHGLGRTDRSMAKLNKYLKHAGFKTANIDYPSRKRPIEELAYIAIPEGLQACKQENAEKIHFITHSMGGIVLRYYLANEKITNLGRVVMLSPPNQGSTLVDEIGDWALFKFINGPAGQQLGTGLNSIPLSLGPVNYPVGIITGNKHSFFDAWAAKIIPGADDGKVSIEGAKVSGMSDFLVVPYAHSFIMKKKDVLSQSVFFLLKGWFNPTKTTTQSANMSTSDDSV